MNFIGLNNKRKRRKKAVLRAALSFARQLKISSIIFHEIAPVDINTQQFLYFCIYQNFSYLSTMSTPFMNLYYKQRGTYIFASSKKITTVPQGKGKLFYTSYIRIYMSTKKYMRHGYLGPTSASAHNYLGPSAHNCLVSDREGFLLSLNHN